MAAENSLKKVINQYKLSWPSKGLLDWSAQGQRLQIKTTFALAFIGLFISASLESALAQPPHKPQHPAPKAKSLATGGVEIITPQDTAPNKTSGASNWNSTYVGVNAGMGFGATVGKNIVVPLGGE